MSQKRASNSKSTAKLQISTLPASPRELKTPSKIQQPGIAPTVYTHVSTLHSLCEDWRRMRKRGTAICRAIQALRLYDLPEQEYPEKLGVMVDSLAEAACGLENVLQSLETVRKQLQAVSRLQPSPEPIIGSWSAGEIARAVSDIHQDYTKEYILKKYVAENIAHCRDEATSEVLVSSWEFDVYVNPIMERQLLADTGIATSNTS